VAEPFSTASAATLPAVIRIFRSAIDALTCRRV
jgi:hypothetical protein